MQRSLTIGGFVAILAMLGSLGFALGSGGAKLAVSQKGRAFLPGSLEIVAGDTLVIRNDDEFVHQVFIDNAKFKFDSGEQAVGETVEITFPASGTYQVLCAIHPKMQLDVVVK